jgi:hypothetical protein
MYLVVPAAEVLIIPGFQVPCMPFAEVSGNTGGVLFWQSGPICVNVGVIEAVTTIFIVSLTAHCPAAGVKMYLSVPAVEVLIIPGFQVPCIPFVEVSGKAGAVLFWQSGPICAKVGVIELVTAISIVSFTAH